MSGPLLILDRVTVGYGRHPVLQNLQLTLEQGSFTALLGANGSGKTTLLKTLVGIIPPLAGKLQFQPVAGRKPVIGYVPQRESLDPIYLVSSFEVVLMGTYGRVGPGRFVNKPEREFAAECLRAANAEDLSEQRFSELSGGQKQRVLIARALATRPDFLLLDEPTAGIDTATARAIMELLSSIHAERNITIMIVTHDLGSVRETVQSVVWLRNGTMTQGSVQEMMAPEVVSKLLHL